MHATEFTEEEKKRSQKTLIRAMLSNTQLDFSQLNHPIFKKAYFPQSASGTWMR